MTWFPNLRFARPCISCVLAVPCVERPIHFLPFLAAFAAVLGALITAGTVPPSTLQAADSSAQSSDTQPAEGVYRIPLRYQAETADGSGRFHRLERDESWHAKDTAVIVCDMWDAHHCLNAVRREGEVAPRMNAVVCELRKHGATIIHAPSGCMGAYTDHPARARAQSIKPADNIPEDIGKWCDQISSEASAPYPLDQSAGGEDDDLSEHEQWAATLKAAGRNPRAPWIKQTDAVPIDAEQDFISDAGPEIWSILEDRNIKHIALVGVHTNMCVLGRPFGLRQLASHGKQVALIRDLTDTMYDPRQWPYVSHFTGTDLIVDHIERYVCPTFTSSALVGGRSFRFENDRRPVLAIIMAEDEYETEKTLPVFAVEHLGQYRVQFIYGSERDRFALPGIEQVSEADAVLVSVRRRPLPTEQLDVLRKFVASGKPVIGVRTASHAFCLRNQSPANGLAEWPEFDAEVLGGHYTNHYGNTEYPTITSMESTADNALAQSLPKGSFTSNGSLYKVSPLGPGARALLQGSIEGQAPEPVAWTNVRTEGGRAFYTSLGHKTDFDKSEFRLLLANGIHWACNQPLVSHEEIQQQSARYRSGRGKQRK
jgi:type 1 glutamine amidotransferase/nicotinamidase-related amidase